MTSHYKRDTPIWFTLLCCALWLVSILVLYLGDSDKLSELIIVRLSPVYTACTAFLANICFPKRRYVSWILIAILILSIASLIALAAA